MDSVLGLAPSQGTDWPWDGGASAWACWGLGQGLEPGPASSNSRGLVLVAMKTLVRGWGRARAEFSRSGLKSETGADSWSSTWG